VPRSPGGADRRSLGGLGGLNPASRRRAMHGGPRSGRAVFGGSLRACPWTDGGGREGTAPSRDATSGRRLRGTPANPAADGGPHPQHPGEEGLPSTGEVAGPMVDDHAGRRAATNQFTVARTCVLMKKASQRVRKCVLIRCMFQVRCSCRSRPYGTPVVPFRASPLLSGSTGNQTSRWRRFGPANAPVMAERRVPAVAVRLRPTAAGLRRPSVAAGRGDVVSRRRIPLVSRRASVVAGRRANAVVGRRGCWVVSRRGCSVVSRRGCSVAGRRVPGRGPRALPDTVRAVTANAIRPSPRSLRGRGDRRDDGRRVTADRRRWSSPVAARAPC